MIFNIMCLLVSLLSAFGIFRMFRIVIQLTQKERNKHKVCDECGQSLFRERYIRSGNRYLCIDCSHQVVMMQIARRMQEEGKAL